LIEIPPCVYLSSTTLTTLNLSRNALLVLPQAIGSLTMLQELNLSRNRLRVLPKEIGALKNLTTLNVLSNNLRPHARSLPLEELAHMPALRVLDLRFNEVFLLAISVFCIFAYVSLPISPTFHLHLCVNEYYASLDMCLAVF
jgi:hypothetical protein